MKHLINNWRGSTMLLSLLLIYCLTGLSACDDIKDEYITDTPLNLLQEKRTALNYLLDNSEYGTAPGTYPESGKDILNSAIAELDALIAKVEAGEILDEVTLEAAIAKVNQSIDKFNDSKYYNLSEEARRYINELMAKADDIRTIVSDEAKWGNHKGQYPVVNKSILEGAAEDLDSMADRIRTGEITHITQEMFNEAIANADKKITQVEESAWPDNSQITWNLFVDGNKGSYIDFGYSEDYVKFGDDDNQAFTIELWVNIKEYCNKSGEDNCTFLSTMTNDPYWSGWRTQDRTKGLLRTMVAHWQDDNHSKPEEWEPGWKKSDNWTKDRWTHYAFLFRDKGLPGFDTPTDVKCYSMIDGTRQGEIIRVGEAWRTYINNNSIANEVHMTGFCMKDNNGNRNEWFSGYIKKIRIWKTNRTEDQVYASYAGNEEGVTADNPNLVEAWDFEVKGDQPTQNDTRTITGLKGHTATLVGNNWQWVETTTVTDNK
ncbi:DUF4972 domain-containing protein [Bacteroides sp.]|uniref:DUF4972 domain-containing protein n=1 Tax=Bacteroides sp. TaxID=29523 RepID=UPI0025B86AA6|nr:DUF4972 domain-containing protein [Bacteroides sp.]